MSARKIMLLGEIGVGKSSLARRLVFDKFEFDYKPTIGVDVYRYIAPATASRPEITLIIWDTDGNFGDAIFKHIYMKEAAGALIIGDVSRPATMETMHKLAAGFSDMFPGRHVGFVVNKSDLVPAEESAPLPGFLLDNPHLVRTSAKTGAQVQKAFLDAAEAIHRRSA